MKANLNSGLNKTIFNRVMMKLATTDKNQSIKYRANLSGNLFIALAVIMFLLFPQAIITAQDVDYDVVVIGGTPAGIAAAIAAG
ncbi:MAG: hypothetical protein AB8H47_30965, partial [Bacteroidia bacterium]